MASVQTKGKDCATIAKLYIRRFGNDEIEIDGAVCTGICYL